MSEWVDPSEVGDIYVNVRMVEGQMELTITGAPADVLGCLTERAFGDVREAARSVAALAVSAAAGTA
jgi:hypothetical protein